MNDAAMRSYAQAPGMTSKQYASDLIAKSCKVADVYVERTLNDAFIEGLDASISHSLRNYWPRNAQADLTDISFQAESLLPIQKASGKNPTNIYVSTNSANQNTQKSRKAAR